MGQGGLHGEAMTDPTPYLAPLCRLCGKPTTWCGQPDGHKCLNADCPPKDSTPQAQDSLTAQLARLNVLAVQHGLYDAADWLTATIERQSQRADSHGHRSLGTKPDPTCGGDHADS